jgi:alpha-glucoside transport system permease protein
MTTNTVVTPAPLGDAATGKPQKRRSLATEAKKSLTSRVGSAVAILIAIAWTLPTFGLFVSSFRPEDAIKTTGWWTFFRNPELTLDNYQEVLFGSSSNGQLAGFFVNSLMIVIPSVVLPVTLASLAAYAFAWMRFPGRDWLFVFVFALQIVPLQMALIPLLRIFSSDTFDPVLEAVPYLSLWLAHTAFALPLAVFLLHNFISEVPGELIEAARVDGAGHVTIFRRIMLPLLVPAIASLVIFQFLWVWNDLLIGLTFAGGTDEVAPITVRLAELAGTRGNEWQRLTAGAFVSLVVPLIVFLSLQRYFVRGLLAGSVKG